MTYTLKVPLPIPGGTAFLTVPTPIEPDDLDLLVEAVEMNVTQWRRVIAARSALLAREPTEVLRGED